MAKRAGPASLDEQLARRLKKPLAQLRWGTLDAGGNGADPQTGFDAAYAIWRAERDAIVQSARAGAGAAEQDHA